MSNTIVDSIMNQLPKQLTDRVAARLGGTPEAVQSGVGSSVAALLAALSHKAGESGFMSEIFNLVSGTSLQGGMGELERTATGAAPDASGIGSRLISMLLGNRKGEVEGLIASQTGLGGQAGSTLMSLAAPLTTGFLAQQIRDRGLNVSSFTNLVRDEGSKLGAFLPAGLGALLAGGLHHTAKAVVPPVTARTPELPPTKGGGNKALWMVLGLVVLGLLAWLLAKGCNKAPETPAAAPAAEPAPAAPPAAAAGPLGQFIDRKLPDGTVLHIPRLGIENKLIDFIEGSAPVDKTTWFDFDRLTFDTGKDTLQPSSSEQLTNIASILKAYPKVKVKIGGYTDNTGNKAANLKLSNSRAKTVMNTLVTDGIGQPRLEAQGYGEEHPVADNSTEEGRAKNRRISLRVTEK